MQDISDVLAAAIEPFQAPPLVAAPYTTITDLSGNARKLPDPSKTIRPLFGNERVHTKSIKLVANEKGPNGEPVYKIDGDERVRFVGDYAVTSGVAGTVAQSGGVVTTSFVEITFYGTGLNLLSGGHNALRDVRATVDNGSETGNLFPSGTSGVLHGRNYSTNQILPIASNLTLGLHTVKLRDAGAPVYYHGFEIIGPSASITIPQGKAINNGKAVVLNSLQSIAYNSNFASGVDNGRGGRVVIYKGSNGVEKALQPTDATAAYLSSASHTNEEPIRTIYWREFGANRSDDFSTLAGVAGARVFTLDNGTTTLLGDSVYAANVGTIVDGLTPGNTGNFITLTFVGTGLDVIFINNSVSRTMNLSVDGVSQGSGIATPVVSGTAIMKIASGLPYGTHTVKMTNVNANTICINSFIIYGPKKPSIPEGAVELGEYYLMSNFVANTTSSMTAISQGTLRKVGLREFIYVNGTGGTSDWIILLNNANNTIIGYEITTNRQNAYVEYTFFGTGFDARFNADTNSSGNVTVSIDGLTFNTTNYPTQAAAATVYGNGVAFTPASGQLDQLSGVVFSAGGFVVSGLPLGKHTVRLNNNTAGAKLSIEAFDIITPIHYPNTKVGSLALKPAIEVKQQVEESNVDLSKAKAWLVYDKANNIIRSSHNIAAVLSYATGAFRVYFEIPFKTTNYVFSGNVTKVSGTDTLILVGVDEDGYKRTPQSTAFEIRNTGALFQDRVCTIAFFGELEGEGD